MDLFKFDYFNQAEIPYFILENPDGSQLYNLSNITERQVQLRLNALSTLTFTAPAMVDGVPSDYFDLIEYRRVVNMGNQFRFMITSIEEDNTGIIHEKKVTCQSLEVELNFKKLSLFKGEFFFYGAKNPAPTLIGTILQYLPDWSVGSIDAEIGRGGTLGFDISDKTIYDFLMNEVSQSFQCIFTFDTINKRIYARTIAHTTVESDIFLSYDNLLETTNIKENTDELVTALTVVGGANLDISYVNPIGGNIIYNFDYYKNTNWMSASLITVIDDWETLITAAQPSYSLLNINMLNQQTLSLQYNAELTTLQGELLALQDVQKVQIQQGIKDLSAINGQITAKQVLINAKQAQVNTTVDQMFSINASLTQINNSLSIQNYFTPTQKAVLSNFEIGSTYTNVNYAKLDNDTSVIIQGKEQSLYDQAVGILAKLAQPRYTFEVTAVNFPFLPEFQVFINQLVLGCIVTIEFKDQTYTRPALLGMDFNYDDPTQFKIIFSNRLRLDDSEFEFSDLYNQTVNSGITTSFNSALWSNWNDSHKNDVTTFITSALNTAKNMVTSGSNQEIIINSTGIRGRHMLSDGQYDPKQFWMINNVWAFTDDSWNSAKLAIGEIKLPDGSYGYGLVSDYLVGRILAGNRLIIENDNNSFTLDGTGATLYNASFTLESKTHNRIILDANKGIEISKTTDGTNYTKTFYVDGNGNITFTGTLSGANGDFTGKITAKTGKIGMWNIDEFGLYDDPKDNYIYGNGNVRLGALKIAGSNAWFHGKIYAENLESPINGPLTNGSQIAFLNADIIKAGTLSAINIFGCDIKWPGVEMYAAIPGISIMRADNSLSMISGENRVTVNAQGVKVGAENAEITLSGAVNNIIGDIQTLDSSGNLGWAKTETVQVQTPNGYVAFNFVNGLYTDSFHYQSGGSSGSSGSTSGSSGDVTYYGYTYSDSFSNPTPPISYSGNGIFNIGNTVYWDPQYSVWFYFRVKYSGTPGITGTIYNEITNISGTCTNSVGGTWRSFSDLGGQQSNWTNTTSYGGVTLYEWTDSTVVATAMGTHEISGTGFPNYTNTPPLQSIEDRWLFVDFHFSEITSPCQWKLNKFYIRPTGTSGESDIILWENP